MKVSDKSVSVTLYSVVYGLTGCIDTCSYEFIGRVVSSLTLWGQCSRTLLYTILISADGLDALRAAL